MKSENFIIIGVLAGLVAVLDIIGVVTFPIGGPYASAFYIGAAFFAAFAVRFGRRGLVAIYIGLILAAFVNGFSAISLIGSLGNVLAAGFVWLLFSVFRCDPELKGSIDYTCFIVACTIFFGVISGVWTLNVLNHFGIVPDEVMRTALYGWIIGDAIVSLIIGIPLFKYVTPVVKRLSFLK